MAHIEKRGPHQYRARVRLRGKSTSRTFETKREALEWAQIIEGKIAGDEFVDRREVVRTTLGDALDWFRENLDRSRSDAKNKISKISYWSETEFVDWSLSAIRPADLIKWRRRVLDEDGAQDGEICGPDAEVGPQTVVHRLNLLSQVYKKWALAHDADISNPVVEGVRPRLPSGRDRRLHPKEEKALLKAAKASSRPWLEHAIILAIETCMRQGELGGLTWDRVYLDATYPHADLPKTKNDRPRRVPLSKHAIKSLRALKRQAPKGQSRILPVETSRGIGHAFRDVATEEKFPGLRWHDLRHEAISRLFEQTDLRDNEIMAISGHMRPEMLTRYTHLRTDRLGERLAGGQASASR